MKLLALTASTLMLTLSSLSFAQDATKYAVTDTFHIGGPGRWDYLIVNPIDHMLYVTRSTHTQVIDTATGKVTADIKQGQGLHGTALVPSANRGFITDGKAGAVIVFDLKTNSVLGSIPAADDADGITYDAGDDRVLVSCGDSKQLVVIDPHADIAAAKAQLVDIGGKLEFNASDGRGKAYVCVNDKHQIAVVDLKTLKVTDTWSCGSGTGPSGLAIDVKNGRLFVGCRNKKLIVIDTADGKVLAELPIGGGVDACVFDPDTGEAFASCGDSTTTVIKETSPGKFEVTQTIATKQGARTMALDPATHTLYLPTADFEAAAPGQRRPPMKPDTFSILVAQRK